MSQSEEPWFEDEWASMTLDSVPDPCADQVSLAEVDSPINEPRGEKPATDNFSKTPATEADLVVAALKKADENAVVQRGPWGWGTWLGKPTKRARSEPDIVDLLDMDNIGDKPVLLPIDAEEKSADQQKAQGSKETTRGPLGDTPAMALGTRTLASSGSADRQVVNEPDPEYESVSPAAY